MRPRVLPFAGVMLSAAIVACGTLTACDSVSASGTANGTAGATPTAAGAAPASALDAAYSGLVGKPPTAPAKPSGAGLVWMVSCGQSVPTCATPASAGIAAAKAAGFRTNLCDGKLSPQGWADCIRQGVSAKAAGIIVVGQDCGSFSGALKEAKAAGIPTVGAGGNDCDVNGGKKLFSAVTQKMPNMTSEQWWQHMGALQADWIIGRTDGKAKVLSTVFTDAVWGSWVQKGFSKELETCTGCSIDATVKIGNGDLASGQLAQKFSTALLKQPTVNAVNFPIDGWLFAGLSQALRSSGRNDQLQVIGAFGEPGNLQTIKDNAGQDASVAFSEAWDGWAGVDALIRLLDGKPPQPAGIGMQVVDRDKGMPQGGAPFAYKPAVDFESAYRAAWGVK